ncbi:hypothetical protein [uncultured Cellulomonas sp.]|uniref:hypothetical protein n=1 Tax=uncultured Cellulomonas sp. TaxID=189682 RepID=UPI0028EB7BFD|nr:hypothetical protein [uncultured Cellulomonas sp.]
MRTRALAAALAAVALLAGGLVASVAAPAAAAEVTVTGRVYSLPTSEPLDGMRVEIVAVNPDGSFGAVLGSTLTTTVGTEPGRFVMTLPASKPTGRAALRTVDPAGRYMTSYDDYARTYPAPYTLLDGGLWDYVYGANGGQQWFSFGMAPAGRFVPVAPVRLADTRVNGHGPMRRGDWYEVPLPVLVGEVVAVVVNVTATRTQCAADYISSGVNVVGFSQGGSETSIVNGRAGADVANVAVVRTIGRDVGVLLYNHACATDVVVDLQGYYDSAIDGAAAGYVAVSPERVLDTRTGSGPLGAGQSRRVDVGALGSRPADAVAVSVNITATGTTAPTSYLSAYATGDHAGRQTSVLNAYRGQDVANLAVVPLADDGSIEVYNNAGQTDVVLDVQGWYSETGGVSFFPLDHRRLTTGSLVLGPGQERLVGAPGRGIEIPADAQALAVNLTSAAGTASTSYVTAYPDGSPRPLASNLNSRYGVDLANSALVGLGPAGHRLYNNSGSVVLLEDIQGYFAPGPLD